jgi:hypothetical protein
LTIVLPSKVEIAETLSAGAHETGNGNAGPAQSPCPRSINVHGCMNGEALNPVGQALANARAVRSLQACEGWLWFVAEMEGELAKITRQVMEEDLYGEEREMLIVEYRTLKAALGMPASVLEGAMRVIGNAEQQ